MKIPLSWLRDYVDFEADAETLAARLTSAGLEVEGIETRGGVPENIIVGEITAVDPHIHANHLRVCLVNNGAEILRVVSGAGNCKAGDKVPLAGIGATLSDGTTVKSVKIRGELSQGVLCAEDELGLSDDHSGLMILPPEAQIGQPLAEISGPPDQVLTVEVTPNRPDLLGLIGVAREVAAIFGTKLKWPDAALREENPPIQNSIAVAVKDSADCPRYTARLLLNAAVGPSPFWLRRRLAAAGIKAINNIVDVTNYVLLECGQPLHAFDFQTLSGGKIIVRRAGEGETIIALDGLEYKLDPQILVIADEHGPVAIAGVMGGKKSGIRPETTAVLLESACFRPPLIRNSSKRLGLATESSYRFERGVDASLADFASRRACALIAQIAGAKTAKGMLDCFPRRPAERKIICRYSRVSGLLGAPIPPERITAIFNALDIPVVDEQKTQCAVAVKAFRPDLESEADLIEEIARIHGLDKIPCAAPRCQLAAGADDRPIRAQFRCRQLLAALGLREIANYSFVSEKLLNMFDSSPAANRINIPRPVNAEHTLLRDSLLPQMAETLGRNRSRQIEEAAFFEIARVFMKKDAGRFHEETRTAVGIMGAAGRHALHKRPGLTEAEVFAWLKGILHNFCGKLLGKASPAYAENNGAPPGLALHEFNNRITDGFYAACLKPDRGMLISMDGVPCGVMGLLKDEIRREWRILEPVGLMEFALNPFLKNAFRTPAVQTLPVYPSLKRDIALRAPLFMRHADIIKTIRKNAPKELTSIVLFDIYTGKEIGAGFKSMAYSLTYQSAERTLTDMEANRLHDSVKKRLKDELKVEIREG
ncbi:MAG: phenylalanine--tRNA ligase subunit beta [Kiritimatiellae bacterium]|nr:phenylalanine--tRNA ligase subunit beta [Kiritimatiellia bacterium]